MKKRLSLIVAGLAALSAQAATFTVSNNADSGAGSLRQAIADANASPAVDTINFDPALNGSTILLTNGQLAVSGSVNIVGPGPDRLVINGNGTSRVFHLLPGQTNYIAGLTITNGNAAPGGGGIHNDHSILTVSNVTLSGNSASSGGGIYNDGAAGGSATLTVQNSTLSGNSANGFGGGLYNEGYTGIAKMTVQNSTLSGNSAVVGGGGIYNGDVGIVTLIVQNSTISGNSAGFYGAGIYDGGFTGNHTLTITHTLLARGASGENFYKAGSIGVITNLGFNFSDDGSTTNFATTVTNLFLGPLANNGGSTRTHALLIGSPAVNAGNPSFVDFATDQRGAGFPRVIGGTVDVGAFESPFAPPVITSGDNATFQVLLAGNFANTATGVPTPTFSVTGALPTGLSFDNGVLSGIPASGTVGVYPLVFMASNGVSPNAVQNFTLIVAETPSLVVTTPNDTVNNVDNLTSLREALAYAPSVGGVPTITFATNLNGSTILLTNGQLVVSSSVTIVGPGPDQLAINGNATSRVFRLLPGQTNYISGLTITNGIAVLGGGGIFNSGSILTVSNVTFSGNLADSGGAIYNYGVSDSATLTIQNSTLSGNSAYNGGGGGIYNDHAIMTVSNVTLSGNSADLGGGGIYNNGTSTSATLTIQNSTLSGNSALIGGGIYNDGEFGSAKITVQNSTLSSNSAETGGGIYNYVFFPGSATLTIQNSTLSRNSANAGGGIHNAGSATVTITHTLLSHGASGENFFYGGGSVTNLGFNLSDDNTTTNFATTVTNLFLGPLANNGGNTLTHALLPGSPAFNAGDTNFSGFAYDQRGAGYPRVTGGTVDIGAFEAQVVATTTSVVSSVNPSVSGQSVTFTAMVSSIEGTPTGTVTFSNGVTSLSSPLTLATNGVATFTTSALAVGSHSITAVFSGSGIFLNSTGALTQAVLSLTAPSVFQSNAVDHVSTRFLQTSLMQQTLSVTNVTAQTLAALRITVHPSLADLAANIRVYNASGTNGSGLPYLQHNFPVLPGSNVTFTVEYYSPDRVTVPTPTFTVELVSPVTLTAPSGTNQPVLRTFTTLPPDNAFMIDFVTAPESSYYILYSTDSVNWTVAQPQVTGTGYVVQWVDNGAPKTRSHPGTEPQRFYQVIKAVVNQNQ